MQITLEALTAINSLVNERVNFTPDSEQWGVPDRWEDGLETGLEDCDGYAIAKLRLVFARLIDNGAPLDAIKLGLCYVETGEYHAVLVATCDGEDYVLDNRYPSPMRWEELPYKWDRFYLFGERAWRAADTR